MLLQNKHGVFQDKVFITFLFSVYGSPYWSLLEMDEVNIFYHLAQKLTLTQCWLSKETDYHRSSELWVFKPPYPTTFNTFFFIRLKK